MKNYKYFLYYLAIISMGCEPELLNTIPNDRITSEIFWKEESDAVSASNALYGFLEGLDKFQRDALSDIAHNNDQYGDYKAIEIGSYNGLNSIIESTWENYYKGIHAANYFLENVGRVTTTDPDFIARLSGEARVIRALSYLNLVAIYGDVPLVTQSLTIEESKNLVRTPKDQVWDFIEEELTSAAIDLPVIQEETGRITKGAALALKARAMLYANRFQKAANAAKEVMDLEAYSLYPSYENLFSEATENNSSVILDRQYIKNIEPNNIVGFFAPFSILSQGGVTVVPLKKIVDSYEMTNGKSIDDPSSGFDPYNPYENRDPRLGYSVYVPGSVLPNGEIFNSLPNSGTGDAWGSGYQISVTGFYVAKYIKTNEIQESDNNGVNIILLRYAEVLLTYAEAKIELDEIDSSVFDAINLVRQRSDVNMPIIEQPKSQDELRQIIRHERLVEFAFEGQRFFDIRRWNIAEQVVNQPILGMTYVDDNGELVTVDQPGYVRSFGIRDYLWPLPQKELDLNSNLVQNPGF